MRCVGERLCVREVAYSSLRLKVADAYFGVGPHGDEVSVVSKGDREQRPRKGQIMGTLWRCPTLQIHFTLAIYYPSTSRFRSDYISSGQAIVAKISKHGFWQDNPFIYVVK